MLNCILKKIGRAFIILTREDARLDTEKIKKVLLISLPSEEHLNKAVSVVRERFKDAEFTIVLPESKFSITPGIALNNRNLIDLERRRFDVIVILSLDPRIIIRIFRAFDCPKLLYNYCGEWYLLRRRSLREFLTGQKGADRTKGWVRETRAWEIFYRPIWNIIKIPLNLLCVIIKSTTLIFYIILGLLFLYVRRILMRCFAFCSLFSESAPTKNTRPKGI